VRKVLVIGANGFVGDAIVRALAASPNFEPVAGVRWKSTRQDGIEQRVCDATDPASLETAMRGIPFAASSVLGPGSTMVRVMRNLCALPPRIEVHGIVHISTMSVYGPATGLVDETAPLDGSLGSYASAKVEAERIARDFIGLGGKVTILRPGIVYGAGGEQWVGRIGRWIRAGRVGNLGAAGEGFCNLIYRDDLGSAVVAALSTPTAVGQSFNLGEPDPITWNEYFTELGGAIGVPFVRRIPRRCLRIEENLAAPPLQVAKLVASRLGLRPGLFPEPIPRSLVALWRQDIRLDHRKADALLGFPRTSRTVGLAAAAEWFSRREGAVARPWRQASA
jgi:nucleoside-diphosphate-sugar epimerase